MQLEFFNHFQRAWKLKQTNYQVLSSRIQPATALSSTFHTPNLMSRTIAAYLAATLAKTKSSGLKKKSKLVRSGLKYVRNFKKEEQNRVLIAVSKTLKFSKATNALYTFFFWTFFFSATRIIFKKRKTALSSYLHTLSRIPYQLPKPIRTTFKGTYKSIRRNANAVFSQPVLSILDVKVSLRKKNANPLVSTRVCALLLTYFFSSALNSKSTLAWKQSLTKYHPRSTASVGAARAVFGLNQYILNLVQQQ